MIGKLNNAFVAIVDVVGAVVVVVVVVVVEGVKYLQWRFSFVFFVRKKVC